MLKRKLLISYSVLIILVLGVMGATITNTISNIINTEMKNTAQASFDEGVRVIENRFSDWSSAVLEISVDEELQCDLDRMRTSPADGRAAADEALRQDSLRLGRMISGEILHIYPVGADGVLLTPDGAGGYIPIDSETISWYGGFKSADSYIRISQAFSGNTNNILILKNVFSARDWKTIIAVVCVEIRLDDMNVLLNQIKIGKTGRLFLAGGDKIILPFSHYEADTSRIADLQKGSPYIDGSGNLVFYSELHGSSIYMIGHISMAELLSKGKNVQKILAITCVAAILLAMGLAVFFSEKITRPILRIADVMKNMRFGNLNVKLDTAGTKDEIRELCVSFNYMMDMINNLIDEVYVSKLNAKQAELMALQAQINPHFLYNTLDSINWMAMKYGAKDIQQMVTALAVMLRRTLNSGRNTISVRHELEQTSSYITIQKYRFDNLFESFFIVDPSIMNCTIIKLILQPLVENAIIHGFSEDVPDGKLIINGYRENDTIIFDIMNNGNPIDLGKINSIMDSKTDASGSYGIKNVNDRLTQQYGSKYALRFFIEGEYTVARITIPFMLRKESEDQS